MFPCGWVIYMIDRLILRPPQYIHVLSQHSKQRWGCTGFFMCIQTRTHFLIQIHLSKWFLEWVRRRWMEVKASFLLKKEDAGWLDCFSLHSLFLSLFPTPTLATSIHAQCERTWKVCEWMDCFPSPSPLSLLQHLLNDLHKCIKQKNM